MSWSPRCLMSAARQGTGLATALATALLGVAVSAPAAAPRPPSWQTTIGLSGADPLISGGTQRQPSIEADAEGNTYVAATSSTGGDSNILIASYDPAGARRWQNEYSGPGASIDRAAGQALIPGGGVVVVGTTQGNQSRDIVTIFRSPDGTGWARVYDGIGRDDEGVAVSVGVDGTIAVVGTSVDGSGTTGWVTLAYSLSGTLRWSRPFGSTLPGDDAPQAVATDDTGRIVVGGSVTVGPESWDVAVLVYSSDGDLLSETRLASQDADRVAAMQVDASGQPVVVVRQDPRFDLGQHAAPCVLAKIRREGGVLWTATHEVEDGWAIHPDSCQAEAMALDSNGDVVVTGYQVDRGGDTVGWEFMAFRYSATGERVWVAPQSLCRVVGYGIGIDSSGGIMIGGPTWGARNLGVVKLDAGGVLQWTGRTEASATIPTITDIAVRADGSVVAAGVMDGVVNADLVVLGLASGGSKLWETRELAASSSERLLQRRSMAVEASGGVALAGVTFAGGQDDWLVTRLDASGETLWSHRFDGAAHSRDWPTSIAVDTLGNTYVAGSETGKDQQTVGRLLAFDPSGNPLWPATYVPSAADTPIFLDPLREEGVWVTGGASSGIEGARYRTGGVLQCSWNLPAQAYGVVTATAAHPAGGLVVTGRIAGDPAVIVARIDEGCGIVWQAVANAEDGWYLASRGVAVAPDGSVAVAGRGASIFSASETSPFVLQIDSTGARQRLLVLSPAELGGATSGRLDAVAFDAEGNTVATGWVTRPALGADITTVSLGPGGESRWVRHFTNPSQATDEAAALNVDADGTILVTGASTKEDGSLAFTTVAYASGGRQLWVARTGAPCGGCNAVPLAAALDPLGGLVIAGNASNPLDQDILVVRQPLDPRTGLRRRLRSP